MFRLEIAAAVRSKTLAMLMVASVAWMLAAPFFLQSDGTVDGARELYVHYAPGGVFALLVVSLLASATGAVASERTAKRLQLSMVRPVRYFTIALAKISALVACGAAVLALYVQEVRLSNRNDSRQFGRVQGTSLHDGFDGNPRPRP